MISCRAQTGALGVQQRPSLLARHHRPHRAVQRCQAGPKDVFVLDLEGVLCDDSQKLYKGVSAALRSCEAPWYVASASPGAEARALLARLTGTGFETEPHSARVLADLSPEVDKKPAMLRQVLQRPLLAETQATLSYVDDSIEVLDAVRRDAALQGVKLYLASWSGASEKDCTRAKAAQGVAVISLDQFCELLTWGLLQGVDDGCEPEAEEKAAAGWV